jgi:hypothetical protein
VTPAAIASASLKNPSIKPKVKSDLAAAAGCLMTT